MARGAVKVEQPSNAQRDGVKGRGDLWIKELVDMPVGQFVFKNNEILKTLKFINAITKR